MENETFDVVIVGAGSAGSVLANRLSQDPNRRVLLLEAGGWDWNPLIAVPLGARMLTKLNLYNWEDVSDPDPQLNGRVNPVPHGRVVGGSSSTNYMAHTRGHPNDYRRWVEAGATGWSYEEVLPFFKACETWPKGEDAWRGGSGELGAQEPTPRDALLDLCRGAAGRLGYGFTEDYNGEVCEGVGPLQYTVRDGRRASSGRQFLRPALRRPNLTVRTGAYATKVLLERGRAIGVEYEMGGRRRTVGSSERVALCLGAINTPHLLMLSGIGPADHLRTHGVTPVVDLPVGKNLEDHLGFYLFWKRKTASRLRETLRLDRIALGMLGSYFLGKGEATIPPGVLLAYVKSQSSLAQPDLELLFPLPSPYADQWFPGLKPAFEEAFGVCAYLTGQESLGEVLLRSADPHDRPRIVYNSLTAPGDLPKLREAYRRAWALGNAPELAAHRGEPIAPTGALRSDAEIDEFLRANVNQQYHPACTCRMGSDATAVLDPSLNVRGVEGLSVVDASAMPRLVAGNPNAVIMMMAAKAASMWR